MFTAVQAIVVEEKRSLMISKKHPTDDHSCQPIHPPSSEMRDLQLSDPGIGPMIHWLEEGKDITQQTQSLTSRALKHFWGNEELLHL